MTMRQLFPGYYRPTDDEFAALWKGAIFAFDANMLLHIYRFTPQTREAYFDYLSRLEERIWIPYQAAYEFQRNRLSVISEQAQAYEAIEAKVNDALKILEAAVHAYKRHPFVASDELLRGVRRASDRLRSSLHKARAQHPDFAVTDPLRDRLDSILDGKIGAPYSPADTTTRNKSADERIKGQIPPGYMDAKKDKSARGEGDAKDGASDREGTRRYGDVILWFQLLDQAKLHQKPIILITDDEKEDWWLKHKGKTMGPRPELIQEMREVAGVGFYMYSSDRFLEEAAAFFGLHPEEDAISEAREMRELEQDQLVVSALASEPAFTIRRSGVTLAALKAAFPDPTPLNYAAILNSLVPDLQTSQERMVNFLAQSIGPMSTRSLDAYLTSQRLEAAVGVEAALRLIRDSVARATLLVPPWGFTPLGRAQNAELDSSADTESAPGSEGAPLP